MTINKAPSNTAIARVLDEIAGLLEHQHANPHRVRAYRRGADQIRTAKRPLAEIVLSDDGEALQALPGIGESLSRLIEEIVKTGKAGLLQRLQGAVAPEDLFEQIPGVGRELAERIVRALDVKTLEDLEQAAHDGRLARVAGFGRRRVEAIRMSLAGLLSSFSRRRVERTARAEAAGKPAEPTVAQLLGVDAEYRRKAAAGQLKKIAPKRFNPDGVAWLPVLHTERGEWSFTALFSNTARAHALNKTGDWVVIFFEHDHSEDQVTVVTETSGALRGKRVVRGREAECENLYRQVIEPAE